MLGLIQLVIYNLGCAMLSIPSKSFIDLPCKQFGLIKYIINLLCMVRVTCEILSHGFGKYWCRTRSVDDRMRPELDPGFTLSWPNSLGHVTLPF